MLTKQTVSERQLLELREEMSAYVEQHRLEALRQRWGEGEGRGGGGHTKSALQINLPEVSPLEP